VALIDVWPSGMATTTIMAATRSTARRRAEAMRWLEWGARSYQNFALGLALLLFAAAVVRTAWVARPIAYLMGLSGLAYLVQGWVAGAEGFSSTHTILILVAWVLSVAWMIWLVVVAWRMPDSEARRLANDGVGRPTAL
jgi:Domain of unknown function (DUF4386)